MSELRVWDRKSIQDLLARSDYAVKRAVLAIYARQTENERREGLTQQKNGVGFSAWDAEYFTLVAEAIELGREFKHEDAERARRRGIKRYWRQLAEIANENEVRKVLEKEIA